MNQLEYRRCISDKLDLYLSSFEDLRRRNKSSIQQEFEKYKPHSLFYKIKLNKLKQSKKKIKDNSSLLFDFLNDDLCEIVIGEVDNLLSINSEFKQLCIAFTDTFIEFYRTPTQRSPELIELSVLLEKELFNYKKLLNSKRKKLIISSIKNKLCPYCSRNYINLIEGVTHNMGINLDHYYSQSAYPLLGVSFYNLIPSCQPCNSAFKVSSRAATSCLA